MGYVTTPEDPYNPLLDASLVPRSLDNTGLRLDGEFATDFKKVETSEEEDSWVSSANRSIDTKSPLFSHDLLCPETRVAAALVAATDAAAVTVVAAVTVTVWTAV